MNWRFICTLFYCYCCLSAIVYANPVDEGEVDKDKERVQNYLHANAEAVKDEDLQETRLSVSYIPVFLIILALASIVCLYVYDVFGDIVEEGGIWNWHNDTISLHCSETSSNQFRILFMASLLFSVGLTWLFFYCEISYRTDNAVDIIWYILDIIAAICFLFVGMFPTHGETTKEKVGKSQRERLELQEPVGGVQANKSVTYRVVVPEDKVHICGKMTKVSREAAKWIHLVTALFAMIELTVSNFVWAHVVLPEEDVHYQFFNVITYITVGFLGCLFFLQGLLRLPCWPKKVRCILCLWSMGSELGVLVFAVATTMACILHRDPRVLWIFSKTYGNKS